MGRGRQLESERRRHGCRSHCRDVEQTAADHGADIGHVRPSCPLTNDLLPFGRIPNASRSRNDGRGVPIGRTGPPGRRRVDHRAPLPDQGPAAAAPAGGPHRLVRRVPPQPAAAHRPPAARGLLAGRHRRPARPVGAGPQPRRGHRCRSRARRTRSASSRRRARPGRAVRAVPRKRDDSELMQRAASLGLVHPTATASCESPTAASSRPVPCSLTSESRPTSSSTSGRRSSSTPTTSPHASSRCSRPTSHPPTGKHAHTSEARELAGMLAQLQSTARQVLLAALDASLARVGRERLGELSSRDESHCTLASTPIYVESLIHAPIDGVWAATQQPEQHRRWDVRFGASATSPVDGEAAAVHYATTVAPGVTIAGTGESLGDRARPDGPAGRGSSSGPPTVVRSSSRAPATGGTSRPTTVSGSSPATTTGPAGAGSAS